MRMEDSRLPKDLLSGKITEGGPIGATKKAQSLEFWLSNRVGSNPVVGTINHKPSEVGK